MPDDSLWLEILCLIRNGKKYWTKYRTAYCSLPVTQKKKSSHFCPKFRRHKRGISPFILSLKCFHHQCPYQLLFRLWTRRDVWLCQGRSYFYKRFLVILFRGKLAFSYVTRDGGLSINRTPSPRRGEPQ